MQWIRTYSAGIAYVLVVAMAAWMLGKLTTLIGAPAIGLLLGIALNNTFGSGEAVSPGIQFSSKKILQLAIILLGCGLSLKEVWLTGADSLLVIACTLFVSFLSAFLIGRLMNIPGNLKSLIAVGTGICGGTAIAAVSPIIRARHNEVAYGISAVFLLNTFAMLTFPALGHWLGLSDHGFGLWAGTVIHDTSSVVATGYMFSDEAGEYAAIVKLTRTTFLIPVVLVFAFLMKKRESEAASSSSYSISKVFPWFIVWFLAASLLNTFGLFNESVVDAASTLAKFLITMALTAIGLSTDIRSLVQTGVRPMIHAVLVWIVVVLASLSMMAITGHW